MGAEGFGGWLRIWVPLSKLEGNCGAEGFGGWLRIWVPLIKLEGNCGGRGVWGLAQDLGTFE